MHLLLIEDDLDLGSALLAALRLHGFSVEWQRRADAAPLQLDPGLFDCVLLDLNLATHSGFELLARWRRQGASTPIIVITARTSLDDKLAGLDGGADDFLVKPFAPEELLSRIRAVVRRSARQASERWRLGELEIEPRLHEARLAGEPLELSPREFQLLVELAREPGVVVPKRQLAQKLEPLGDALNYAAIEMHVFNLRRKIGAERVRTVRGVGYALNAA
ncbi:response regulator transcription factor [Pelomonas sp. SE-A7]|uniref:response regulator n=1 Tax=Pelomonas sp. SE-A7 TaxID=3054953 RepID=UPI00259D16DA|nr:response regulator transcription factor [Pelomonas sp. SE-A7]MDM4765695.1 response regulator transcription factor [Pelomonas sp. SE-A7]